MKHRIERKLVEKLEIPLYEASKIYDAFTEILQEELISMKRISFRKLLSLYPYTSYRRKGIQLRISTRVSPSFSDLFFNHWNLKNRSSNKFISKFVSKNGDKDE